MSSVPILPARLDCLSEYAEVFKTVCVDAAYYKLPDRRYLEGMVSQVPAEFQFGFKVTDEITVKRFQNLPRFGTRAGQANPNFLNADLFATAFLKPCEEFRPQVGLLMFEFSRFRPNDYEHGRDFLADLDVFLGNLPKGWPYAVEMRNKQWLVPDYFACLARHGVTHVFNSWEAMPPVSEQIRKSTGIGGLCIGIRGPTFVLLLQSPALVVFHTASQRGGSCIAMFDPPFCFSES